MQKNRKMTFGLAAAATLALGMSTQANAYIFNVAEEGGWTASDSGLDVFSGAPADNISGVPEVGFNTVSWFAGGDPMSSLDIDFFSNDIDVPDGGGSASALAARITQNNQVIFGDFPYSHTLDFAALFRITDANGGGADGTVYFEDTPTGTVTHVETLNSTSCTDAGDGGVFGPSLNLAGTVCDDMFAFTLDLTPPVPFQIGDMTYTFDFAIVPGPGVIVDPGTQIFYTPEGGSNFVDVVVTISSVPAPATLALLGIGLAGLGLAGRRKARA